MAAAHDESRTQIRGSTLLLVGRVVGAIINLFVQVLVVRSLSKVGYGAFAYALAVAGVGEVVAMFGMRRGVSRFLPIFDERGEHGKVAGTLVLTALTIVVVGLGFVLFVVSFRGVVAGDLAGQAVPILVILSLLAPIMAAETVLDALFAVFSRPLAIFLRQYLLVPGLRLLAVLVIVLAAGDAVMLAVGYVMGGAVGVAVALAGLWRIFRRGQLIELWRRSRIVFPVREVFAFSIPLLTDDLSALLIEAADALMLGQLGTSEQVAALRAVLPVARANEYVSLSFGLLFLPLASRLHARADVRGLEVLYWRTGLWSAVLAFPVFAALLLLAEPVTVLLFGQRYASSAPVLSVLAAGYYVSALTGPNEQLLAAAGRVGTLVSINGVAVAVNVAANLMLIPRYGALGAGYGTLTTFIVLNVARQAALYRCVGVRGFRPAARAPYAVIIALGAILVTVAIGVDVSLTTRVVGVVVAATAVLVVARRSLDLADTFPELERLPGLQWLADARAKR